MDIYQRPDLFVYSIANSNAVDHPVGGMPAWQTFNFKSTFTINETLTVCAGLENILDLQYRTFASGMNASVRNVSIGAKFHF